MGNQLQIANQTAVADFLGSQLVVEFQTAEGSGQYPPARYIQRVVKCSGQQPSYAIGSIPMKVFRDEAAPTCALMFSGPAGEVTLRTRASCSYLTSTGKAVKLLNGTLVTYTHGIGNDTLGAMIIDDRWILSKFTCFGRWTYDPQSGTTQASPSDPPTGAYYLDPVPLVFNKDGWPDCFDTPYGPMFAPSPRYGYKQQWNVEDIGEPAIGLATTRARSWTVGDAITHLRNRHSAEMDGKNPMVSNYGSQRIPKAIIWPVSLGSVFNANRTLKNFTTANNTSLLEALQKICRRAGAYDLYSKPTGAFNSTLSIVNMNPKDHAGGQFYLPSYLGTPTIADVMGDSQVVWDGTIVESIINLFDDVCIPGDPPSVERFVSTQNFAADAGIDVGLEYAWDRGPNNDGLGGDEQAFKDYMSNAGITATPVNSVSRFQIACKLWTDVFCNYRMKKGFDIWKDTKYDGTVNMSAYARIKAYILTGFNMNSNNPGDWDRLPVTVEYNYDATNNHWRIAQQFNGQEIMSDERTLRFQHLRDNIQSDGKYQTWYNTGAQYAGATMKPCPIRLTIAAKGDWFITGRAGQTNDAAADPNNVSRRLNKKDNGTFTWLAVAHEGDYVDEQRIKSKPNGYVNIDATHRDYPNRCTVGNELFTDLNFNGDATKGRLPLHALARLADVKRIEYTGQIAMQGMHPAINPGDNISVESASSIGTYSVCKCVIYDADKQASIVELSSEESSVIYDMPMPPRTGKSDSFASYNPDSSVSGGYDSVAIKSPSENPGDKSPRAPSQMRVPGEAMPPNQQASKPATISGPAKGSLLDKSEKAKPVAKNDASRATKTGNYNKFGEEDE